MTGHPQQNMKQDAYFQFIREALPVRIFTSNFHSGGNFSDHLVNTTALLHKQHIVKQPVVTENAWRRPSFLRLDSKGESSKNEWLCSPSGVNSTSSGDVRMLPLFSDILRSYADSHEKPLRAVQYHKPKPLNPFDSSTLNITSAVHLLCQKNSLFAGCQNKTPVTRSDYMATSRVHQLPDRSEVLPNCVGEGSSVQCTHLKQLQLVSDSQPAEHPNNCCQELQYDFNNIAALCTRNLIPPSVPYVTNIIDAGSVFRQLRRENSVHKSVVSFRSCDPAVDVCTADTRWLRLRSRWPRFNCRRKCLRVRHNTRFRRLSAHSFSATDDGSVSDVSDLVHPDIDKIEHGICENKSISSGDGHLVPELFSSIHDLITPCIKDDAIRVHQCYSQLSLPSSSYDIQETLVQESCGFASSLFISAAEIDSSDSHSTDSDDSDFRTGFLSLPSAWRMDEVLAEALLPCFQVPFADNWMMEFSDCTPMGFDSEFEMHSEADGTSIPCSSPVSDHLLGVEEANVRWNEAYSFPADMFSGTPLHHSRMV